MSSEEPHHHHPSSTEKAKCTDKACVEETLALETHLDANPDLKKLRRAIEKWYRREGGTPCFKWLTPQQWADLGYDLIHDGAVLVLDLTNLVGKYGYWWSLGHSWNMGFHKFADDQEPDPIDKLCIQSKVASQTSSIQRE